MRQDFWGLPLQPDLDIDILKHLYKVPVHQHTKYGEQAGRTRDLCAVTKL